MKIALLSPTSLVDRTDGARTFVDQCLRIDGIDSFLLGRDRELETTSHKIPDNFMYHEYNGTIISTCLYESDDHSIIDQFPRPRFAYLHSWSSIKHGHTSWIPEFCDALLYDRPMLARYFTEKYPDLRIPYRELTLPYTPSFPDGSGRYNNLFFSHGRIMAKKGFDRIVEAAQDMPDMWFHILGVCGESDAEYLEQLRNEARKLENLFVEVFEYGCDNRDEITKSLQGSAYYIGLTKDTTGYETYGIEYAAMEAMDAGCIPIVDKGMEFEYLRQGAVVMMLDVDQRLAPTLRNYFDSGDWLIQKSLLPNRKFLAMKNVRFEGQLDLLLKEFS